VMVVGVLMLRYLHKLPINQLFSVNIGSIITMHYVRNSIITGLVLIADRVQAFGVFVGSVVVLVNFELAKVSRKFAETCGNIRLLPELFR